MKSAPRNGDPGVGPVYSFGRATVNFDTFDVTVAGERQRLTHTEMKLLRYFVEKEGVVVTRAELLEHVWGMSHMPTTRVPVRPELVRLRRAMSRGWSRSEQ